jgi:hypothetical protein
MVAFMKFKIKDRRREIECATADDLRDAIRILNEEDQRLRQQGHTPLSRLAETLLTTGHHWDGQLFWKFVDNLGEAQKKVLGLLVHKGRMTDEEVRTILGLDNNQQLAGVLSGISKQAAALNISAREVYTINKEFESREVTKTYVIAADFQRIATEMNWSVE